MASLAGNAENNKSKQTILVWHERSAIFYMSVNPPMRRETDEETRYRNCLWPSRRGPILCRIVGLVPQTVITCETTYHLFVAHPTSLIGLGDIESFQLQQQPDLIQRDGEPGDSFLGWGENDTGFTPDFPAFEGTCRTFEGFYYDSTLQTPILGDQFAQITLPAGSEFSLSGIARYLVAGQKIDFYFDFNSIPAPSTLALVCCFGLQRRRRKPLDASNRNVDV